MTQDLHLAGKWSFSSRGKKLVVYKKSGEKPSHVWLKALVWALYLADYPDLTVEVGIGHRYKPDLISMAADGKPLFWGECGQVTPGKLEKLFRQFPETHFVVAKWGRAQGWDRILQDVLPDKPRKAPVELICFPEDSGERYISERGEIAFPEPPPRTRWT